MLRAVAYVTSSLVLLLVVSLLLMDLRLPDLARSQLDARGLGDIVTLEGAGIVLPDRLRSLGATLHDPATGLAVATVDEVDVELEIDRVGGRWLPRVRSVTGEGARVVLSRQAGEVGFIRALRTFLDGLAVADRDTDEPPPMPSLEFRRVDIVVQDEGGPLQVLPDSSVWVRGIEGRVRAEINLEGGNGLVQLDFDRGTGQLVELVARDMPITPELLSVISTESAALAAVLSPRGDVDLDMHWDAQRRLTARGELQRARLEPDGLPAPLEDVFLPFTYADGHLVIAEASIRVGGGDMLLSVDHGDGGVQLSADLVDAEFREEFARLLPAWDELDWASVEDGGGIELHVSLSVDEFGDLSALEGWGGVHVRRGFLTRSGTVPVEDLVARFQFEGDELRFEEASARFAGGFLTASGTIDLRTDAYDASLQLADLDVDVLRPLFVENESAADAAVAMSGWLQGDVQIAGVLGDTSTQTGRGQFSVRGGNIWRVRLFSAIANALRPGELRPSERHRLTVDFLIDQHRVRLNLLRLDSEFLPLVSNKGKLAFKDDVEIDIEIVPISVPFGAIGDLIEYIQKQLVRVEVKGTLGEPEVKYTPVKVVTRPLGKLFEWVGGLFGGDE